MKNRFARALGTLALLSLALAACGDGDKKKDPDVGPFLGVWSVGQAAVNVNCGFAGPRSGALTGTVTVAKAQGADVALTFTDPALAGCTLRFNLASATTLSPAAGQSCAVSVQGINATFTVASGTFTVIDNLGTMSVKGTAVGALGNLMLTCMGDVTGTLSRGGNADAAADAS